ncbi:hypothetical protein M3Y96_00473500 [Aphelenchoides besseyi]|nr:hypothetical protein M3Y96_00473500 [Aphelenchoides besseyi]
MKRTFLLDFPKLKTVELKEPNGQIDSTLVYKKKQNVKITTPLQELGRLTALNRSLSAIVYVDDDMEGLLRNRREYRIEDEALNAGDLVLTYGIAEVTASILYLWYTGNVYFIVE